MKSNIFRRSLCIIIAISMIVSGSLVPCGNITEAYASSDDSQNTNNIDFENGDDIEFAGGAGTKDSPYLIETVEQLSNIKHQIKDAYYYKMIDDLNFADVDGEGHSYEEVYGDQWVAIGTDPTYFSFQGYFDGNGHTISNMNITSGTSTGVFGYCNGTITNLKVVNSQITTTGSAAGALVGELLAGGEIDRCAAVCGSVAAAKYVGGLVGIAYNGAKISNVYVDGVEIGLDYMFMANKVEDSLLGGTDGLSITNCIDVIKESVEGVESILDVIDLVFEPAANGVSISSFTNILKKIKEYLNGDFLKTSRTAAAGGIVGFLSGDLDYAWVYTTGNWKGAETGVYIADRANWWATLSGGTFVQGFLAPYGGPIVGRNFYGSVTNAFETTDDTYKGLLEKAEGAGFFKEKSAWFKDANNVPRISAIDISPTPEDTEDNRNNGIFSNAVPKAAVKPSDENGDGVYEIYTPYELAFIEYRGWWNYELKNDLYLKDCGDPTHKKCTLKDIDDPIPDKFYTDEKGLKWCVYERNCVDWGYWIPLCRDRDQYFDGNFYGNGHTIYGLNVATNDAGGLFGYVLGDIMDLNVSVDKIDAYGPAGGLAAGVFYPGNIYRCSVVGPHGIAGDTGENDWDINGGANVDGAGAGGLAGFIGKDVEVKDCYTRVNVTNSNWFKLYELDFAGFVWSIILPGVDVFQDGVDIYNKNSEYKKQQEKIDFITGAGVETLQKSIRDRLNALDQQLEKDKKLVDDALLQEEEASLAYKQAELDYDEAVKKYEEAEYEWNQTKTESASQKLEEAQKNKTDKENVRNQKKEQKDKRTKEYDSRKKKADENEKKYNAEKEELKKTNEEIDNKKNQMSQIGKDKLSKAAKVARVSAIVKAIASAFKNIGEGGFKYASIIYENRAGGFVGDCRGRIINCYSAGKVFSSKSGNINSFLGGFVGRARTGDTSTSHDGKIMGVSEMIQNCYYNAEAGYDGAGTKLSADQMKQKNSYVGFDFNRVWSIDNRNIIDKVNNGLPYLNYELYSESNNAAYEFAGGDGSEESPFLIATKEQFLLIDKLHFQEYHYKLLNNINGLDLSNTSFLGGTNDADAHFAGHFDGNGYAVSFVNAPNDVEIRGLFPTVSGTVCNLEIRNSIIREDVSGGYFGGITSGSVAGVLNGGGHLENIYINSCTVWGEGTTGGLVGKIEKDATVKNCMIKQTNPHLRRYAQPIVGSTQPYMSYGNYGLIAGINYGNVEDCYASGNIVEHEGNLAEHCRDVKTIGASAIYDVVTSKLTHKGNSQRMYFTMLSNQQEKHENCQGTEVPTNAVNQKASYNGLDFANTWTMAVDANNNPTGIGLRCMRSTLQSAASEKELAACYAEFNGTTDDTAANGNGTKENPFKIDNEQDLIEISELVKNSPNGLAGIYFRQENNIDLSKDGVKYTAIGTSGRPFSGVYDGNGYTITLKDKSLFGYIDGVTIKNLVITVKETIESASDEDIYDEGLGILDNANCGILTCMASNSLIFNCSIERDAAKVKEDLASKSTMLSAGGFAATAIDCNIINCKSEAVLTVTSQAADRSGVIAGEIINTDKYNGTLVGLNDSIKPAVINCAVDCRYDKDGGLSVSSDLCGKTIGQADSDALIQNVGISVPDNQNSFYITLFKKTQENIPVDTLNNTEELPDELVEEAYVWKYNEGKNDLSLKPGICNVTIKGTDNVSIERIFKVTVQKNRDTWEEIPVYTKKNQELSIKNGTKLVVEVSNDAEVPNLRWEMRNERTDSLDENRYVQQEDKNDDSKYEENELLDSSTVEFVVDDNMTVHVYDESEREFTDLYASTGENPIEVSQYEQLTLSALRSKGVHINKGYNYGYSEEILTADGNLDISPAYFTNVGSEQTVTVSYTHDGRTDETQFKVNVIPRVMTKFIVTEPETGITGIQEYESIEGGSLYDAGARFYKKYNFGPDVEIEGNELRKITAAPVMHEYFGRYKVQVTYTDGAGEESQSFIQEIYISIMPRVMTGILVGKKEDNPSINFQAYEPITADKLINKGMFVNKVYAYGPLVPISEPEKAALVITPSQITVTGEEQPVTITYTSKDNQSFTDTLNVNITRRILKALSVETTGTVTFDEYQTITATDLSAKGVSFKKEYEYGDPVTIAATESGLSYTLIGANAEQQHFIGTGARQIKASYTENGKTVEKTFTISITPRVMNGIDAVTTTGSAPIEFQVYEPITVEELITKGVDIKQTYQCGPSGGLPVDERDYLSVTPSQFAETGNNQTITITYSKGDQTYTDTLSVNITDKQAKGIAVEKKANIQSINFQQYEDITIETLYDRGMEVKKEYDYAPAETLELDERQYLSVTPSQITTAGNDQSVTITYSKDGEIFTDNLNVNITSKQVKGITVEKKANIQSINFQVYEDITIQKLYDRGMEVKKEYDYAPDEALASGEKEYLSVTPSQITATGNNQPITITYNKDGQTYTDTLNVNITSRVLKELRVETTGTPQFSEYQSITAAALSAKGVTFKKVYDYGDPVIIGADEDNLNITPKNVPAGQQYFTGTGSKQVEVTYTENGNTVSKIITVNITARVMNGIDAVQNSGAGAIEFQAYEPITVEKLINKGVVINKKYAFGDDAAVPSGERQYLSVTPSQITTAGNSQQITITYSKDGQTYTDILNVNITSTVLTEVSVQTTAGTPTFSEYQPITAAALSAKGVIFKKVYEYGDPVTIAANESGLSVTLKNVPAGQQYFTGTGSKQVEVTYTENGNTVNKTITVNITARAMNGIDAVQNSGAGAIEFQAYEPITVEKLINKGVVINKKYAFGDDAEVPSGERQYLSVTPSQITTAGNNKTITITYSKDGQTYTDTLNVNITSTVLTEVSVQTTAGTPTFSEYQPITAAALSAKGVIFKKVYEYGDPVTIAANESGLSVTPKNVPAGQQYFTGTGSKQVEVTYTENGNTVSKIITVNITAKVIKGVSIEKNPDKLTYDKGENINLSGGKLRISYEYTDHTDVINMTASGVSVEGYDKNTAGIYDVYLRYNGVRSATSLQVTVGEILSYTIEPDQAGFTLASKPGTKQNVSGVLWVKNNLHTSGGGNTRRAYVKFDLTGLEEYMAAHDLEIKNVQLSYSARIDRTGTSSRTIYVKKVEESGWKATDLTWSNAPAFQGDIATATISGAQYQNKTADVTAYLKSRIAAESSTASLGFEVSRCGGEVIGISYTTSDMPTLTVTLTTKVMDGIDAVQNSDTAPIEFQAYEPITVDKLINKGVVINKKYEEGSDAELSSGERQYLSVEPNRITTAGNNQTITITYSKGDQTFTDTLNVNITAKQAKGIAVEKKANIQSINFQANEEISIQKLYDRGMEVKKEYDYAPAETLPSGERQYLSVEPSRITTAGNNQQITITYSKDGQTYTDTLNVNITSRVLDELSVQTTAGTPQFTEYQPITAAGLSAKGVIFKKVYEHGDPVTIAPNESGLGVTLKNVPAGQQYFTGTANKQVEVTYTENGNLVSKTITVNITARAMNGIDAVQNSGTGAIEFQAYEPITVDKLINKGMVINQKYEAGPDTELPSGERQYLSVEPNRITTAGNNQTITITYSKGNQTYTDTLNVNITAKQAKGIAVEKKANIQSINFQANEEISIQKLYDRGMEVKKEYDYAPAETLPSGERQYLSVTPSQITTAGNNQQITITYSNNGQIYTDTLNVNITSRVLDELSVQNTAGVPQFVEYQPITAADLSAKGVIFKKVYEYGDPVTIAVNESGLSVTPKNVPAGQQYFTGTGSKQVEVTYTENGNTVSKTITVNIAAAVVKEVSIETKPGKLIYDKGENINLSGGKLRVAYEYTDHTDVINMTASGVTVEGYDKNTEGIYDVYLRYNGVRSATSLQVVVGEILSYAIEPEQAGFTLASQPGIKQDVSGALFVKNNLQTAGGGNTRRAYVKFDLTGLEEYMAAHDLEIENAQLSYSARIDRTGTSSRTIYVKKVEESGWKATDLTWRNAPALEGDIATATISGAQYQNKTADVTAYLKSRIAAESSTASLGFEVSRCNGEMVCISYTTSDMPTLNITFKTQESSKPTITIDESNQNNQPIKSYEIGDNLDLTKGRIKVTYADGRAPEYVALNNGEVIVTGYNKNTLGEQTLTVKYRDAETNYKVTVKDKITSVTVDSSTPPQYSYAINQPLNKNIGRVVVEYASGAQMRYVLLSDSRITVEGYNPDVAGVQNVTVNYTDENGVSGSGSYTVLVSDTVAQIAFSDNNQPKKDYTEGQPLDRSQGKIKVTYSNGSIVYIPFSDSRITVSGYNKDQVKAQTIRVVYEGKEVSYTVNVNKSAGQIAGLNIQLNKAIVGQNLGISSAGVIKYTGKLANTQTSSITDTANIQITGFNKNKAGNQTITVSYGGYSKQMTIYVYTKKTETIKIGVSNANHSKKTGSLAALTSNGYVKNNGNNTMETYIKMSLIDLQIIENRDIQDFKIKSARLKFQAKGYGNSTTSRRLQLYKVNHMSDSALNNGGKSLSWSNGRLKDAIGSYWCVNKDASRNANWDVTAYVKERYENAASVLFGFGLTQNDGNKEVRILDVYDASKTYLEVTVEYLQ